jgi:hypothetical protein
MELLGSWVSPKASGIALFLPVCFTPIFGSLESESFALILTELEPVIVETSRALPSGVTASL